jgi:hypothetical protein
VALPAIPTEPTSWSNHGVNNGCEVTVKSTALLSFMLGATETSKGPVVAPAEIVITIDALDHELTVIGALFSVTKLPPCEAPKPVPVISTWLPIDPVVAETLVITGARAAVELTETLSKVAVTRAEFVSLVTANPTKTFCAMAIAWLVPSCTQFTPSDEI